LQESFASGIALRRFDAEHRPRGKRQLSSASASRPAAVILTLATSITLPPARTSNLPLINDLRLVNDGVVILSPIERIQPFDAVLSVLYAEEKGHRLPTDRFGTGRPRTVGEAGFLGVIACCSLRISPSTRSRPIMAAGT
jgi:hypothetical protein